MAGMTSKITVKSFVVVCIFVQMLTLLPHHHHGESHLPCVNLFHCTDQSVGHSGHAHDGSHSHTAASHSQDAGCTAGNHSHDTGNGDCSFEHKDVISPDRADNRSTVVFAADFLFYGILNIGDSQTSGLSRHESMISLLEDKRYAGVPPLHTDYIALAIPPRAPSFTA